MKPALHAVSEADRDTLARTIYGEARGEPQEGQIAVAWVIVNRAVAAQAGQRRDRPGHHGQFGDGSVRGAALAPSQFSCWNPDGADESQRAKLQRLPATDPVLQRCRHVADAVLDGQPGFQDPTAGCRFYFNPDVVDPPWAKDANYVCSIGHHDFYLTD
jgi:N-acetylmuramoyl-L-alanine amidase